LKDQYVRDMVWKSEEEGRKAKLKYNSVDSFTASCATRNLCHFGEEFNQKSHFFKSNQSSTKYIYFI